MAVNGRANWSVLVGGLKHMRAFMRTFANIHDGRRRSPETTGQNRPMATFGNVRDVNFCQRLAPHFTPSTRWPRPAIAGSMQAKW